MSGKGREKLARVVGGTTSSASKQRPQSLESVTGVGETAAATTSTTDDSG